MASEFVVIVLGVLVALGLESSWQGRQDRVRETSLIQDLTVEFRRNRDLLLGDLDRNRASMASAEEGSGPDLRRQFLHRTNARGKRDVIGQQERLLGSLDEILSLLEGEAGR